LALFRNSTIGVHASPFLRAGTLSNSAIAWLSCRLIVGSYRNVGLSSQFGNSAGGNRARFVTELGRPSNGSLLLGGKTLPVCLAIPCGGPVSLTHTEEEAKRAKGQISVLIFSKSAI
jgi:hypothetical protein